MTLEGHEAAVWAVAIMPINGLMLSAGGDNQILVWQAGTCKAKVRDAHKSCIKDIVLLGQDTFMTCANDGKVRLVPFDYRCREYLNPLISGQNLENQHYCRQKGH